MIKILANDGISASGKQKLEDAGHTVVTETVAQDQLIDAINNEGYHALLVRSATKVRKDLIDACPGLKLIGRGGVGMDNIDVEYARSKGIHVINTPAASSQSVAELAIGSIFSLSRFTYDAARQMPERGEAEFKTLKKAYSKGTEVRGKVIGIIGLGGIGKELARYAIGCGLKIIYYTRRFKPEIDLDISVNGHKVPVPMKEATMEELLEQSDFISLHVPKQEDGSPVIGAAEIAKMKKGVCLINTSRGGSIDEDALLAALESGHVRGAALDVFTNEPTPRKELLTHPRIISTPHIGGSTVEAQDRIGTELADQIMDLLG